jgi:hypothetical protein
MNSVLMIGTVNGGSGKGEKIGRDLLVALPNISPENMPFNLPNHTLGISKTTVMKIKNRSVLIARLTRCFVRRGCFRENTG